jgi:hypothetical protein
MCGCCARDWLFAIRLLLPSWILLRLCLPTGASPCPLQGLFRRLFTDITCRLCACLGMEASCTDAAGRSRRLPGLHPLGAAGIVVHSSASLLRSMLAWALISFVNCHLPGMLVQRLFVR